MPTTILDKVILNSGEETTDKPILVWNPSTRRVSWQKSPNPRIAALEAKLDSDNNFKFIPDPGYTFNAGTRVLTMSAGWIGTIDGVDYTNAAEQEFPAIPLAASGYSRIDLIVFKTDTTFERIAGTPSLFTPVAPAKPTNTLEATFLTVGDGIINVPATPKPKAPVTSVNGMVGDVVIKKATDTVRGTVKIDTPTADPVVYVKETVDTLLDAKANFFLDIKNITGITYNVILTDILYQLVYNGTLAMNVIIPNNSVVPFPIGTIFYTLGTNTGILTASGAAGVTLNVKAGISLSAIQNEVRQYTKIGVNTWSVRGDLNLGAVTQQELSYLQGLTSNIQAQLNAKTALSGGTANFLMKWLTATTATVSRIWDTGTFLGIGTANTPTKDLTFGNQANREIGVEQSTSNQPGRQLVIRAGKTINYSENNNFNTIPGTTGLNFWDMNDINGVLLFPSNSSSVKTLDSFFNFGTTVLNPALAYRSFALDSLNNLYAATSVGLYKQTNSIGNFIFEVGTDVIGLSKIRIHPNGDLYAIRGFADNGPVDYVYVRVGNTGNLTQSTTFTSGFTDIDIAPNGDVYAVDQNGVYKRTGGNGAWNLVYSQTRPYSVTVGPNGWIYVVAFFHQWSVWSKDNGASFQQFFPSGNLQIRAYIKSSKLGDIFIVPYEVGGGIQFQQNYSIGQPNLDGGTLKHYAGTGKGTGKSRYEIYTGQKLASGTDMQVETLREYIDENGYHVYTSMPVHADNAAALAANLPVGCKYRNATGDLKIVY